MIKRANQRQHLSAVKNSKLSGIALAKNFELYGHVRRNLSNCAVDFMELTRAHWGLAGRTF